MIKNNIELQTDFLNLDIVRNNIPHFSSQKLCDMIVCARYFKFDNEISISCMKELSGRRSNGEIFDFENYIEKSYNELPELQFSIPDLRSILIQVVMNKIKK